MTQAESNSIHHYRIESSRLEPGSAHEWLKARGICSSSLIPFLYFDQEHNPRWLDRVYEEPLPPFRPPWSSKEEFVARAGLILEAYPELKKQPYTLPDYQPEKVAEAR